MCTFFSTAYYKQGFYLLEIKAALPVSAVGLWEEQRCCPLLQARALTWLFKRCGARDSGNEITPVPPDTVTLLPAAPYQVHATEGAPALPRACSNLPLTLSYALILLLSRGFAAMDLGFPYPQNDSAQKRRKFCCSVHLSKCRTTVHLRSIRLASWFYSHVLHFCAAPRGSQGERFPVFPKVSCILHYWQSGQWTASCRTHSEMCVFKQWGIPVRFGKSYFQHQNNLKIAQDSISISLSLY